MVIVIDQSRYVVVPYNKPCTYIPSPIKPNKKYVKREPWVTLALLTSSRNKYKLLMKKLKTQKNEHIERCMYYINIYNKLRRYFFTDMLSAKKHNMKEAWSVLKQTKSDIPQFFIIINLATTEKYEIAKGFNDLFANIGKLTSDNVPYMYVYMII